MTIKKNTVTLLGGPADGLTVNTLSDHVKVVVPGGKRAIYRPKHEIDKQDAGAWVFEGYEEK